MRCRAFTPGNVYYPAIASVHKGRQLCAFELQRDTQPLYISSDRWRGSPHMPSTGANWQWSQEGGTTTLWIKNTNTGDQASLTCISRWMVSKGIAGSRRPWRCSPSRMAAVSATRMRDRGSAAARPPAAGGSLPGKWRASNSCAQAPSDGSRAVLLGGPAAV